MPRTRAAANKAQQQLEPDTASQSERSPTPSSDDQSEQDSPELERLFTDLAQAINDSEAVVRSRWDEAQTAFGAHINKLNRARRHRKPFAVWVTECMPQDILYRTLRVVFHEHWDTCVAQKRDQATYRKRAAANLGLTDVFELYLWFGKTAVGSEQCWKKDWQALAKLDAEQLFRHLLEARRTGFREPQKDNYIREPFNSRDFTKVKRIISTSSASPSEAEAGGDGDDNSTRQTKATSANASSSRQQKTYTQASESQTGGDSQRSENIEKLQGPPDGSLPAKISRQQEILENKRVASADLDSDDESDTGAVPNQEEAENEPGDQFSATGSVILGNQRAAIDAYDGRREEDSEDGDYGQNPNFGSNDNDDTFGTDIGGQSATSTPQHKTRQGDLDAESNYSDLGETAPGGEVSEDETQHSDSESSEEEFFDSVFSHKTERSTLLDTSITLPRAISMEHNTQGNKSPSATERFGRSKEQEPAMLSILDDMRKDLAAAVCGAENDSKYRRSAHEQQQEANKEIDSLREKHHARIDLILGVSHDDLLGDKATWAAASMDAAKNQGPSTEEIEMGIAEANRKRKVIDFCMGSESAKRQKVAEKVEIARQAIRALAEAASGELPPLYEDKASDVGDTEQDVSYGKKDMVKQWDVK
ncbi:hypothetical protein CGLO_15501 [Colletotrichum gloeosporioides Cg-14]|uniref:Uncharacterized protein n=1 Tax=Colletotrichum gloeosporioides (strain Cg-14) TaxID=1237896 RepID=T0JQV7_COLGC|nr:hypothetical protein CGLO_15501 [Colletotrichum gloeosporioides Cg-14]